MEAHNPQRWEPFTSREVGTLAIAMTTYLVEHIANRELEDYDYNLVTDVCKMVSEMNVSLGSPPMDPRVFVKLEQLKEE